MAKMNDLTGFTGSLSNLSAYKMRGVDGVILRSKGGPNKSMFRKSPRFESVRKNNSEFAGRARACRHIMEMMYPLKTLADYNIAGPLNALLRPLQVSDADSPPGQRNIYISKNKDILRSFTLNRRFHFDSVIRTAISCDLRRTGPVAYVNIPLLRPDIQLFLPGQYPFYSFTAVLGVVPDIIFDGKNYEQAFECHDYGPVKVDTPWFPAGRGNEPTQLEIKLPRTIPGIGSTMLLSIGLRLGQMVDVNTIEQVKYAGMGKVLGVG